MVVHLDEGIVKCILDGLNSIEGDVNSFSVGPVKANQAELLKHYLSNYNLILQKDLVYGTYNISVSKKEKENER